jgi:hypothetical protein
LTISSFHYYQSTKPTAPEKLPLPLLSLEEMEENLFGLQVFGHYVYKNADVRSIAKQETDLKKINNEYQNFMGLMERRFTIHLGQIKQRNASTSTEMVGYSSRTAKNHVQGKGSSKDDRDEDVEYHGDPGIEPAEKNQSNQSDADDDEEVDKLADLETLEHDDRVASQATNKKNKKQQKSTEVKPNEDEESDSDLEPSDSDSSSEELESDDDRQAVVRKGLSSDNEDEKLEVEQEKLEDDTTDENELPQASSSRKNTSKTGEENDFAESQYDMSLDFWTQAQIPKKNEVRNFKFYFISFF